MNSEICKGCGRPVKVMCQRMTGYCSALCADLESPDPEKVAKAKSRIERIKTGNVYP